MLHSYSMNSNSLSIFFPCINEEGNIENIVKRCEETVKKLKITYEIIIIDDGSTDQTGKIADKLASENSHIRVIHHPKNLGYGEALKSGFYNARYETIVYTDGDGQFDFAEVTKFLEKIKDHDLVIGYRIKRQDPFLRRLFGKGWRLTLLAFFHLTLKDVDCGFKMVKRKVLEIIPLLESQRGAMINAELAIKAKKYGFKVTQIGVNHYSRLSGRPTGASMRVIIKSYIELFRLWWKLKDQKWLFITLVLILTLATFLRFYKLPDYMTFLGDEGRDALIMKKILMGDFPLIGPPTSVGNIYLGPLYYYMMFIPMALFNLNPVSAAAMNAVIGVLTIGMIYYLGKIWFGKISGLVASYLYAISPVTIIYSRSSWNPNPAPFFALLGIFGLYKINKTGNFLWLILTGFSFAAALQMHYLALILIPIGIILYALEVWFKRKEKERIKNLFTGTILAIVVFLLLMSPLIIFDLKHNLLNYRAITELLSGGNAVKTDVISNLARIPSLYSHNLIGRLLTGENYFLVNIVSVLSILPFIYFRSWSILALGIWLVVGFLGVSFYQQDVYDHYLGFLNPVPFLLLGSLTAVKIVPRKLTLAMLMILIIVLTIVNLQKNPLLKSPNNQLLRTQQVAKFIISETQGKDYNFALLSKNNYDAAYQFYLEQYGHKPKQVPFEITDQLIIVCEDQMCDPTHSPKYEIAGFGMTKIEREENRFGVKIYKLISNPSGKP